MKITGVKCPHCNAALGEIEEGRTNIFCTYCGSALFLDIQNEEVKNIVEIKKAEADLTNAKANYLGQDARHIEAEINRERYLDSKQVNAYKKQEGMKLVFWGILLCIACCAIAALDLIFIPEDSFVKYWLLLLLMGGFFGGVALVQKGYNMRFIPIGQAKIDLENEKMQLKLKIDEYKKEAESQWEIIGSSGALIGKKASMRRAAQERLKYINAEIAKTEQRIDEIDERLGNK